MVPPASRTTLVVAMSGSPAGSVGTAVAQALGVGASQQGAVDASELGAEPAQLG